MRGCATPARDSAQDYAGLQLRRGGYCEPLMSSELLSPQDYAGLRNPRARTR